MRKRLLIIGSTCAVAAAICVALSLGLREPIQTISADNYVPTAGAQGETHGIRINPARPFRIGEEFYPLASKANNEQGRCVVEVTVSINGLVTPKRIAISTGFSRLDNACLDAVRGQYLIPAANEGIPYETATKIPIVWKLHEDQTQQASSKSN